MTITAQIVADSISDKGVRLVSVQLRYPKFIHGELVTHRVFSRGSASSRAIPVERMIQDVLDDPAMPVHWGKKQKGMQADQEHDLATIAHLKAIWLHGRDRAVETAQRLLDEGLHKQIANRVLEPWFHINTLVTATEWENFFSLRCHKDAQPEMQTLARAIAREMALSVSAKLTPGEWHLPYVTAEERIGAESIGAQQDLIKLSVARCARVSYLTQQGAAPQYSEDMALYERLVVAQPIHASPAEHQATPDLCLDVNGKAEWQNPRQWRNFMGWRQYRAMIDQ